MSIKIDSRKCTGCGKCRQVCPGNLLWRDTAGKTVILSPRDCWGCTSCIKECRFAAIKFFLGADVGGKGGCLHIRQDGDLLHWVFTLPDAGERVITVDKTRANAY